MRQVSSLRPVMASQGPMHWCGLLLELYMGPPGNHTYVVVCAQLPYRGS
jgi:hypothetical protein